MRFVLCALRRCHASKRVETRMDSERASQRPDPESAGRRAAWHFLGYRGSTPPPWHLEHLECGQQPHAQDRGAEKLLQLAGRSGSGWRLVFFVGQLRSRPAVLRPPMRSRGCPTELASCRWTQPRCPTSRSRADALRATTSQLFIGAEDGVSRKLTVTAAVEVLPSSCARLLHTQPTSDTRGTRFTPSRA